MVNSPILQKKYKDHTVENAITDLKNIPLNAKSVHLQPIRNMAVTIQVLNEEDNSVIETITGKASAGSVKMDSSSLIRRTGSLTLSVDPDLFPSHGSLIWFGNYIRIYVGLEDMTNGSMVNFLLGTFWIDEGGYSIDDSNNEISIVLSDKMTKFDDTQLEYAMKIPVDTPIADAMRLVMENVGETNFGDMIQPDLNMVVPYTLEYGVGDEVTTVITALRDMYMDCYCGYDIMGNFEFKQMKVQRADEVSEPKWRFDSTANDRADLTISFKESYNLKAVKNHIIVYGGTSEKTGITPVGEVRITDAKSPFNVDAIGDRKKIVVESKYANGEQCYAKARYDVWKSSNFQEVASISCVPIYMFDSNDIIEITHPETKEVARYMIDSFDLSLDVSSPMSINAHKLYYIGLEYGAEMEPIVQNISKGIMNWGWISLAEERIKDCYNMIGSGKNQLTVRFVEGELGGEQASVTSYATTKTQTMQIDIADFAGLIESSESGDNGRSKGDYADRVIGHEMFHAVMNDYLGHDKAIEIPVWFREAFAEFLHGAKERFQASHPSVLSQAEKRAMITNTANAILGGTWTSMSEVYVSAYITAIAIYRLCTEDMWKNLFIRLRNQENLSINFLLKLLPIADTNDAVKELIMQEINAMDDVWAFLFDDNDTDTGSVGGYHFMNLYGVKLDAEDVFNNANATVDSIGFVLKIEK